MNYKISQFGGWKSQIKASSGSVSGECPVSTFTMVPCTLHPPEGRSAVPYLGGQENTKVTLQAFFSGVTAVNQALPIRLHLQTQLHGGLSCNMSFGGNKTFKQQTEAPGLE